MSFRLEVDPDQVRERGGPAPRRGLMVAFVAALVLGGSAAGVWAAWRIMSHHGSGAVPLIRADTRPVKVPPADPGGLTVPDQDKYILNRGSLAEPKVEQLLPPPEAPLPRPVPSEPVVTEAAPAAAPPAAAPPPVAAPAVDPAPSVAAIAAPAVAPPPAAVPPPASAARPAAVASGAAWRLQVGALRSPEDAAREWARLKRAQPDILGSLGVRTARVSRGGQGVFYRIEAGPLADADAATRACDELKRRKVGCILVKP